LAEDIPEDYVPPQQLIADVGKMVSDARDAGPFRDGAGLRSVYNPGLAAVPPGTRPYGVYYLYYIHTHGLVSGWDWVSSVAYMLAFRYVFLVKTTYTWL